MREGLTYSAGTFSFSASTETGRNQGNQTKTKKKTSLYSRNPVGSFSTVVKRRVYAGRPLLRDRFIIVVRVGVVSVTCRRYRYVRGSFYIIRDAQAEAYLGHTLCRPGLLSGDIWRVKIKTKFYFLFLNYKKYF